MDEINWMVIIGIISLLVVVYYTVIVCVFFPFL